MDYIFTFIVISIVMVITYNINDNINKDLNKIIQNQEEEIVYLKEIIAAKDIIIKNGWK